MTKAKKYFLMFISFSLIFAYQQRKFVIQRHNIQVAINELKEESVSFKEKYDYVKGKKPDLVVMPYNFGWIYEKIPPKIASYLPKPAKPDGLGLTRFTPAETEFDLSTIPLGWNIDVVIDLDKLNEKEALKLVIAHEIYHVWETLESTDIKAQLDLKAQENLLPYEDRPSEKQAKAFQALVSQEIASKKPFNTDLSPAEPSIDEVND